MTGRSARHRQLLGSRSRLPREGRGFEVRPKHDPKELSKQADSIKAMEERNKKRIENAKKTGKFEYDVAKISAN